MNKLSPEILERMHGKRAQGAELKDIAKWLNEQNILTPHGKKWDEFLVHRKINPRRTKEKVTA
jgi:plasmid replication initiation protein